MTEAERLYRASQDAICSLITESNLNDPVPACPGWSLKDLLGHTTGALVDLSTGNREGASGPEWTGRQVDRYRDTSLQELKTIWLQAADSPEAQSLFHNMGTHLLPDVVTHEYDVRGAMGNKENRDSESLRVIYPVVISWLNGAFVQKGLPAITVSSEVEPVVIGKGKPQSTLVSSLYELSRVFTGRRSAAQISAMDWSVDPAPWIDHLSVLGRRASDLVE